MVERILHRRNIQHQTAVERCIQSWTGSLTETSSDKVKMQKKGILVVGILFCMLIVVWFLGNWLRVVRQIALWDTTRIRFGKFASLFAFVLFASGCGVRIGYESFLDCSLQEFFYVSRMANSIFRFLLDSCYCKLSTLCRGQLALLNNRPRRAEPARPLLPAARILVTHLINYHKS